MSIGPWRDVSLPVYTSDAVNSRHFLNQGRLIWLVGLSETNGGKFLYDLLGRVHGTLTGLDSSAGWRSTTRPGGFQDILYGPSSGYTALTFPNLGTSSSFAAWVYRTGGGGGGLGRIFETGGNCILFHISGGLRFTADNSANLDTTETPLNEWTRLLVSRSGSIATIYRNGRSLTTGSCGSGSISGSCRIGNSVNFGDRHWDGRIDDFSVWSRPLTAAEALADYELSRIGYPGVFNRFKSEIVGCLSSSAPATGKVPWHLFLNGRIV